MNPEIEKKYIYIKMGFKALKRSPSLRTLGYLFKYFSLWREYMVSDRNSVIDKQPWLTFPAIDFVKRILKPGMKVFEFGSGGSTLFWAGRTQEVVSVEHDEKWYALLSKELEKERIENVSYLLIPPRPNNEFNQKEPGNPDDYVSADENYRNHDFREYVSSIDRYPAESFDIILVDGRARPSCIAHSLEKLKKNGFLIIDNSERSYYLRPFNFNGWKAHKFFGPVPYTYSFSETTIIEKR